MDFHSLARRDLQALCKKNKIPANITNVAMADALESLQHVEGIEEFMVQSETNMPQSPERSEIGSSAVPLTRGRASRRQKGTAVSSVSVTQTRCGMRRVTSEDICEESQDVKVNETPAVQSGRRRIPATPSRRKLETQMKDAEEEENLGQGKGNMPKAPAAQNIASLKGVYSSRRRMSVRMLEKTMGELTLKDKGATKAVDIGDFTAEETKNLVEPVKEEDVHGIDAGSHVHTNSDDCLEKMNQNTDNEVSEIKGNQEDENIRDNDKCDNYVAHGSYSGMVLDVSQAEKSDDLSALSGTADEEETDEGNQEDENVWNNDKCDSCVAHGLDSGLVLDVSQGEKSDDLNALSVTADSEETNEGRDDVPDATMTSEAEAVDGVSEIENEKGLIYDQASLAHKVSDEASVVVLNTFAVTESEGGKTEDESQSLAGKTLDSQSVSEENIDNEDHSESKGPEFLESCDNSSEDAEQLGPKCTATELSSKTSVAEKSQEDGNDEDMKYNTEAALVDVEVTESLESAITIRGRNQLDKVPKTKQEFSNSETLVDVDVKPEIELGIKYIRGPSAPVEILIPVKKTIPPCFLVYRDGEKVKSELQSTFQTTSATRSSKQVTVEKPAVLIEEVEKENKLESAKEKAQKEDLDQKSLRELKKMVKRLTIADKETNNGNKNVNEVQQQHLEGKMKQPLSTVQENGMDAGEAELEC